ncbi:YnfA family protein [Bordetella sp. LUAb4]|uniref:YnfA family protein n=1 Tax=Bordetella sp. LUAb4 TaxID=2843195 RepID=UPI00351CF0EF
MRAVYGGSWIPGRGAPMVIIAAIPPRLGRLRITLNILLTTALYAVTALAEIVGCYLPWLVLKQDRSPLLLIPAAVSLAVFAWLLTLHPSAAGRTYAAYGGMYIAIALIWLRIVDGVPLTRWDITGAAIALAGMAVIAFQPSS